MFTLDASAVVPVLSVMAASEISKQANKYYLNQLDTNLCWLNYLEKFIGFNNAQALTVLLLYSRLHIPTFKPMI